MAATRSNRPQFVKAKGPAQVWFYRDPGSIHVYVRPLADNKSPLLREPISFRLPVEAKPMVSEAQFAEWICRRRA